MPNNLKWYFYLLLLAPVVGYFTYYNFNGYIAWQMLSYLVLPLYTIFLHNKQNAKIVIPKFFYFYIAYAIYIYAWKLFNGYYDEKGLIKYIFNNYHVYYIFLLAIIYNTNISHKTYKNFIKLIKITLFIALIGVLIQFFIPNWMIRPIGWHESVGNIFIDRRPSIFTYVSDNEYGVSVLAFFSLIFSIQFIHKNVRWLIIFFIIIGLYSILSNTRYIMAGFVLVLLQFVLSEGKLKKFYYIIYFALALGIIYYLFTDVLGVNLKLLEQQRLFAEGSITATTRYGAYINFLRFFPEKPILGTGVHLTSEIARASRAIGSSQIHVGYLSHLVSYGLLGTFLLFSFWFYLARDLYRKAKQTTYYGPFFAFCVFLWFNVAAVDFKFRYPGLIIAFVFSQYYYSQYIFRIKLKNK